jgi:hypothetical protein
MIGQYRATAIAYRNGTWDSDLSGNIRALLAAIVAVPPYRSLDLGCALHVVS